MKEVKRIFLHSSFMPFINYQLPFIEHEQCYCVQYIPLTQTLQLFIMST